MTPFEFFMSMIVVDISFLFCTFSEKWYYRAPFGVVMILMAYFAGSMGGYING
jgi:hypothetical protein